MAAKEVPDEQLRRALEDKGVHVGPITDTTREVYRGKLHRLSGGAIGGMGAGKSGATDTVRHHSPSSPHTQQVEVDGSESTPLTVDTASSGSCCMCTC